MYVINSCQVPGTGNVISRLLSGGVVEHYPSANNALTLRHEGKEQGACVPWVAGCICFEAGAGQPHPFAGSEAPPRGRAPGSAERASGTGGGWVAQPATNLYRTISAVYLHSPESFGGISRFTVKHAAEVSAVVETNSQSDFRHAERCLFQQLFGLMNPVAL